MPNLDFQKVQAIFDLYQEHLYSELAAARNERRTDPEKIAKLAEEVGQVDFTLLWIMKQPDQFHITEYSQRMDKPTVWVETGIRGASSMWAYSSALEERIVRKLLSYVGDTCIPDVEWGLCQTPKDVLCAFAALHTQHMHIHAKAFGVDGDRACIDEARWDLIAQMLGTLTRIGAGTV